MTYREGRWSAGFVPDDERERLRSTFGEALSRSRRAAGLSVQELADRSGISTSQIYALQNGSSRTRPVTIAALSRAVAADDAQRLEHELTELAGDSLRPDTPANSRRRQRREERARRALAQELPALEAKVDTLLRKANRLADRLGVEKQQRPDVVASFPPALRAGETDPLRELAAIDRAVEAHQRQADAQQWDREQKMMRGDL